MKLSRRWDSILWVLSALSLMSVFGCFIFSENDKTYAESEEQIYTEATNHFVIFYDGGEKLIVKTDAKTVQEAIARAGIVVSETDKIEPNLETEIDSDNFFINIYRSRPVVIVDGKKEKYVMTASYDEKTIMREAGIAIYDGDEIKQTKNMNFLEHGSAEIYEIVRNGGRRVTIEEEIPFETEEIRDYNLASGVKEVKQLGEVGVRESVYEVFYINNEESSRVLVSETEKKSPVKKIVMVGAKPSISPEEEECASWVRAAGVSEADLMVALQLIYRESGCRVDAQNAYSGAYGIPQALPGSKMAKNGSDWETNPVTQIKWMAGYVTGKYGGWQQAMDFWWSHGWY